MYICVCVYEGVIYIYICMHVCMCMRVCACVHVCMCACVHVCARVMSSLFSYQSLSLSPSHAITPTRRTRLFTAINSELWDESKGCFRDNPTSQIHPQDGNSIAVWFKATTAERRMSISTYLLELIRTQ